MINHRVQPTLEYFEYGGFESLNKIPVARLSDGVLLNLQLLFTFEWQFTIEKRLVLSSHSIPGKFGRIVIINSVHLG